MSNPVTEHGVYFDPNQHWQQTHIIGLGATGSRFAEELARLGVSNVHLYDFDTVGPENIRNQRYFPAHVDMKKVDALASIMQAINPDIVLHTYDERFDVTRQLSGTVCLMVDTMQARKDIVDTTIATWCDDIPLVIDAGIDIDTGRSIAFDPSHPEHVLKWGGYWKPDSETPAANVCTDVRSAGVIAGITTGLSVQQFIRWHQPRNHNDGSSKGGVEAHFDNLLWFTYGDDQGRDSPGFVIAKEQWGV